MKEILVSVPVDDTYQRLNTILATLAHLDIDVENIIKIYCDAKNNYSTPEMIGTIISNYLATAKSVSQDVYKELENTVMRLIMQIEYYFYAYDIPLPINGYSVEKRTLRFLCGGFNEHVKPTQIFDYR